MNPETWERVKDTFAAAVELTPDEGERLIRTTLADDESAREEALAMLRASRTERHFLDQPAIRIANLEGTVAISPAPQPGAMGGQRFRIGGWIAAGGLGKVYGATGSKRVGEVECKAA